MSGIYDVNLSHTRWTRCARQRGSGAGATEPPCGQWAWSAGQPPSGSPPGQGNHRRHAAGQVNAVHVFCGVVKLSLKERYSLGGWGNMEYLSLNDNLRLNNEVCVHGWRVGGGKISG